VVVLLLSPVAALLVVHVHVPLCPLSQAEVEALQGKCQLLQQELANSSIRCVALSQAAGARLQQHNRQLRSWSCGDASQLHVFKALLLVG
jgi:hypothetical protein